MAPPRGSVRTVSRPPAFTTRIDLPAARRVPLVAMLNARLADALDLYSQTKQAHWNVKGPEFYQLHLLFDTLAETIEEHADTLAERATALGGTAEGTVRMAAEASSLPAYPAATVEGLALVAALADRYAAYGAALRGSIHDAEEHEDPGTADVFTELSRDADQALYFLEAHLQGPKG